MIDRESNPPLFAQSCQGVVHSALRIVANVKRMCGGSRNAFNEMLLTAANPAKANDHETVFDNSARDKPLRRGIENPDQEIDPPSIKSCKAVLFFEIADTNIELRGFAIQSCQHIWQKGQGDNIAGCQANHTRG